MPWHFGNVRHILVRWHSETGMGDGGAINTDASSSNVAFFLAVCVCVCVCVKRWLGLYVQSLTFLPAHPQIWVSNPQSENIFGWRSRTKLFLLPRCGASHLSCVPLSGGAAAIFSLLLWKHFSHISNWNNFLHRDGGPKEESFPCVCYTNFNLHLIIGLLLLIIVLYFICVLCSLKWKVNSKSFVSKIIVIHNLYNNSHNHIWSYLSSRNDKYLLLPASQNLRHFCFFSVS